MPQTYMVASLTRRHRADLPVGAVVEPQLRTRPGNAGTAGAGHDCIVDSRVSGTSRWCWSDDRPGPPHRDDATGSPAQQHHGVGQLLPAHQQVGQVRVGPVVEQRRAVEPGRVHSGRPTPRPRARPNPTPTGRPRAGRRRRLRAPRPSPWRLPTRSGPARRPSGPAAATAPGRPVGAGGDADRAHRRGGAGGDGVGAIDLADARAAPTAASVIPAVGPSARRRSCAARARCAPPSRRAGLENSQVPSTGSTIHTRSASTRDRSSTASSDSTASAGRSRANREDQLVRPLVPGVPEVIRVPVAVLPRTSQQ